MVNNKVSAMLLNYRHGSEVELGRVGRSAERSGVM